MNILITRFVATVVALAVLVGGTIFLKKVFEIPEVETNQIWVTKYYKNIPYRNIYKDTIKIVNEYDEWALIKFHDDTLAMNKEQIFINYKLIK